LFLSKNCDDTLPNSLECRAPKPTHVGREEGCVRSKELAGSHETEDPQAARFKILINEWNRPMITVGFACYLAQNPIASPGIGQNDGGA
jgi:hypothetical protein